MNDYMNILKEFWKKHGNKIFCCFAIYFLADMLYTIHQDPVKVWADVQRNIVNPWYYIPIGLITLMWLGAVGYILVNKYYWKPLLGRQVDFLEDMKKGIEKSIEETKKMKSGEIPSDEDIKKYYKMYLKKFDLDNRDQWTTEESMSFEKFEKDAKSNEKQEGIIRKRQGWEFLIAMTSDAFSFDPVSGQSIMYRYRDYEELVEEDENFIDSETINKQLDII